MYESIGYPTRFIAIGQKPGFYSHVYVQVRPYGDWISAETTNPVPFGFTPPAVGNPIIFNNFNS